jgi:ATP-dependent RNA helicase SUPV3L1/SUV3
VDIRDDISTKGLIQFAENYAKKGIVRLKEIFTPGTLQVPKSHNQLKELESIHKVIYIFSLQYKAVLVHYLVKDFCYAYYFIL